LSLSVIQPFASIFKRIFKTPKLWECKALEEDVEIRLDNISDDVKTQTQAALMKFTNKNTVKSGQILQIAVDGNMNACRPSGTESRYGICESS
jgi:hypothetical protein